MGGGIASAIARALGARRRDDADALVLHALAIAAVFALVFTVGRGGRRALALHPHGPHRRRAGCGAGLFQLGVWGAFLVWLFNALSAVIRGTGSVACPAYVTVAGCRFAGAAVAAVHLWLGPLTGPWALPGAPLR